MWRRIRSDRLLLHRPSDAASAWPEILRAILHFRYKDRYSRFADIPAARYTDEQLLWIRQSWDRYTQRRWGRPLPDNAALAADVGLMNGSIGYG